MFSENLLQHDIRKCAKVEAMLKAIRQFQAEADLKPETDEISFDIEAMFNSSKETTERIFEDMKRVRVKR